MTDQKLIDDVVTAFADRDITAPSRDDIARVLEVFETSLRRCGCDDCTTARRERIALTDHDRTSLARVLHEVVYSPGASFDRAVPGIQEYMRACAEKVAAALPWVVPTPEAAGSCWDAAPQVIREGVHDPMPTLCELTAGHQGAHRSGRTEWMHSRPLTPTDDEREAQANRLASCPDVGTGFRRTEVLEPSVDVAQVLSWIDRTLGLPMYQTPALTDYDDAVVTTLTTVRKMLNGTTRPDAAWRTAEPQGEPSDAVIVDMLSAFYDEERDGWSMGKVRRMRAALRAAGEVTR